MRTASNGTVVVESTLAKIRELYPDSAWLNAEEMSEPPTLPPVWRERGGTGEDERGLGERRGPEGGEGKGGERSAEQGCEGRRRKGWEGDGRGG